MVDTKQLTDFLLKARTETYAGEKGKVSPALPGSKQLEYADGDWLYCDVYFVGNGRFMGLETVYHKEEPVWSMSYYGDFSKMTEDEVDSMLRKALIENWQTARTWQEVEWEGDGFTYVCEPDFEDGSIKKIAGREKITKNGEEVYYLFYAGALIG